MHTEKKIPNTMQAAIATDGHGGIEILTKSVPKPGKGEVLVRMAASPINESDHVYLNNRSGSNRNFPLPAGLEGSGIVVNAGKGLFPSFLYGKRVAFAARKGGAWSEYTVVNALACFPINKHLPLESASMLLVNPLSAYALINIARRGKHSALLNTAAASAIGQMIFRLAKRQGIEVINVVRRAAQETQLKSMGARYILNSSDPKYTEQLGSMARELNVTLFLDAVGGESVTQLVSASPNNSRVICYGNLSGELPFFSPYNLWNDDKIIEGFYLGRWTRKQNPLSLIFHLNKVQNLARSELATKIHQKFTLSEIEAALANSKSNASNGKTLLVLDRDLVLH